MAVGGMVGGGIFSTLGVVVGIAGKWAWLSFALAGLIALAAGYSYIKLAARYKEGGGAFAVVCGLAFRQRAGRRIFTGFGTLAAAVASVALMIRLVQTDPLALILLGLLVIVAVFGRPFLLRCIKTETRRGQH